MWVGVFPELSQIGEFQEVSRHAGSAMAENQALRTSPAE